MHLNSLFKHWSYRILAPGTLLRERYEALKRLLEADILCHEQMAQLQELLHRDTRVDFACIRWRFKQFSRQVALMIDSLEAMDPGNYSSLRSYHKKFDFYTRFLLAPPKIEFSPPFVVPLDELFQEHQLIGKKAKHLAALSGAICKVPQGFAISGSGYYYLFEYNNLRGVVNQHLATLEPDSLPSLARTSEKITDAVLQAKIPPVLLDEVLACYDRLQARAGGPVKVAVRSNAINEDDHCSFAGQYLSRLNVSRGEIGRAYLDVVASKYSPEALFYRVNRGFGDEETAMSVLIMEMVSAKVSGVLYTCGIEPDSYRDCAHLHAVSGQGEKLVGGESSAHHWAVNRNSEIVLRPERRNGGELLSDHQVRAVAGAGMAIENYFQCPQDIEWAINREQELYILQARTLQLSLPVEPTEPKKELSIDSGVLLFDDCRIGSPGVGSGRVYIVRSSTDLSEIPDKAVLVSRNASPHLVKAVNRISALISEHGTPASHFATIAREFGLPFICNVAGATDRLRPGSMVTVDGFRGAVYQGETAVPTPSRHVSQSAAPYQKAVTQAMKFITPLELVDPGADNFTPEGCRSMHDIIRFCHEKAILSMFTTGRPGTGRSASRLKSDILLDVYLFDVGGGIETGANKDEEIPLCAVNSEPFQAIWKGLTHCDVQWKHKPFDWTAYDRIELSGGVPPKKDDFTFASYAVIGADYLHFNLRFGYHFTIVDVMCGENSAQNHCMLRFAGGGGDFGHRCLRIHFIAKVLDRLEFQVELKGDLLEAKIQGADKHRLWWQLDMLGRLLGATKLMDMVLEDDEMVDRCVTDFFNGRYSFSKEG
ncbi:PEP/pyruvate-binding domain-containing protein [Desulforhopalus singaporensis]|uniref:Phosphoenolpyruvate synthase n=1 Tax=Desulforhopalus singaporensis TaxID=91360 RepID=A0A1H0QD59_9BACT|nr:PEP/pyruvate-binding domain-containing protein [Desulforhopalus singaporensis]SDP14995.1 pyruvate, water dikinase [Desulforhopalus singaporensis]